MNEIVRLRNTVEKVYELMLQAERERDEALAQVALFAQKHPCCSHASPDKARTILDRLRRAEAVAEAIVKELPSKGLRGGPDNLGCGIGVWIDPDPIFKALAAWEANK